MFSKDSRRLVLSHFWVAFAAFFVALVLGEWQMYIRSPLRDWIGNPELYYRSVTAHGSAMGFCTMDAEPAPLYLGVDNEPAEMADVLTFLAAELGLPTPQPEDTDGGEHTGSDRPTAARRSGEPSRGGNKKVSNALLRGTGLEFTYPSYREGYRAVLAGVGVRHP